MHKDVNISDQIYRSKAGINSFRYESRKYRESIQVQSPAMPRPVHHSKKSN